MDPEPRTGRATVQQQQQARSRIKHQKLRISFVGYTIVLVFLAALQFIGVYLFTKGFLLSRSVLPYISTCGNYTSGYDAGANVDFAALHDLSASAESSRCFPQPKFKKAVVLIVDALRFDFVIPVDPHHPQHNRHFHNNLPVLHELAQNEPKNAFLLKFIADPPTTTLQRLKGLTTGSLPTFIDAGSNFDGDAIDEDNWILQLHRHQRKIAFMGDDTWTALFQDYMCPALMFPYESLNVWDLHTVDNGVLEHLFPLLDPQRAGEWDVLIGHFLGVDHAGHRYGPSHHAMREKLSQMDAVVRDTISQLDDETLLVVMGDHGMDRTGNHGGDSPDEVESTLFFYTKTEKFAPKPPAQYNLAEIGKSYRAVNQIDLVPTISLLLGLPIPFNNLGFPIDEAFASPAELARATQLTMAQLARYREHSKEVQGAGKTLGDFGTDLGQLGKTDDYAAFIDSAKATQLDFLEHCKFLWARFDLTLISLGIATLILSLTVVFTYSRSIPSVRVSTMSFEFIGSIIAMSLVGLVLSLSIFFVLRPSAVSLKTCLLCGTAFGITVGFWAPIMDRFSVMWLGHQLVDFFVFNFNMWSLMCLVFVSFHGLVFASNSYVVWEDKMVSFFISTFGFSCLYGAFVSGKPRKARILGIAHALTFIFISRVVTSINLCREEQMPYCTPTFKTTRWSVFMLYVAALVLPKIIKSFYANLSSYHSAAPLWIESGLSSMMLMNAAYWTLELLENDAALQRYLTPVISLGILKSFKLAIARIVLFAAIVLANFSWSRGPLCVKIEYSQAPKEQETSRIDEEDESSNESSSAPSATILGYSNVYGSSYFLLVLNLAIAVLLVTKPIGALSLCILIVQILTLLELYDLLELRRNIIAPVIFLLLGYQHYFSTGHQATIPSIQWEVGFMTTQTIFFPFTHLNIFLNTFGSFLIVSLSIPLITLWKIPPSAKPITVLSQVVTNATTVLTYQIFTTISSLIFAANFRRHLMVWKVFAPRFMFSALLLVVLNVTLSIFTTWLATGRVLTQINRIFGK